MFDKKNVMVHLVSLGILLGNFVLARYVFLPLHGMLQWPEVLLIFGVIVLVLSFIAKGRLIPVAASLSYIVSFFTGVVFQTDGVDPGGGRTNNLWIIWTMTMLVLVVLGIVFERIFRERK